MAGIDALSQYKEWSEINSHAQIFYASIIAQHMKIQYAKKNE